MATINFADLEVLTEQTENGAMTEAASKLHMELAKALKKGHENFDRAFRRYGTGAIRRIASVKNFDMWSDYFVALGKLPTIGKTCQARALKLLTWLCGGFEIDAEGNRVYNPKNTFLAHAKVKGVDLWGFAPTMTGAAFQNMCDFVAVHKTELFDLEIKSPSRKAETAFANLLQSAAKYAKAANKTTKKGQPTQAAQAEQAQLALAASLIGKNPQDLADAINLLLQAKAALTKAAVVAASDEEEEEAAE